jgi:hypothetical protein
MGDGQPPLLRLFAFAMFACIVWFALSFLDAFRESISRPPLTAGEWVVLWAGLIVSAQVVLLVHELGHLLGGWLVGYRLQRLVVGPLTVVRDREGMHARLNRDPASYGGRVEMEGATSSNRSRTRAAVFIVMGPLASLAAGGIVTFAGLEWLSEPAVYDMGFRGFFLSRQLAVVGVGSIIVGAANLVPLTLFGRQSDGARLFVTMWDE